MYCRPEALKMEETFLEYAPSIARVVNPEIGPLMTRDIRLRALPMSEFRNDLIRLSADMLHRAGGSTDWHSRVEFPL